ncbi:MAG: hypothetical protein HY694_18610 [Deltaproteobacteria bacterium]|nr:hypothetical protein [Deltaproteobacteria bacterium]
MLYDAAFGSSTPRVPVPSGKGYRIDSPPGNALVTHELADELKRVLERFAMEAGFTESNPISFFFEPGVVGHHKCGRAADIYAVGGIGLDGWKRRWDEVIRRAGQAADSGGSAAIVSEERKNNLGWRLYKALQLYGRWSQPYGYPIQLFGPWTRSEGPWKHISERLLHAHRDHIHVAK